MENRTEVPKKLKIELSDDPGIPLLAGHVSREKTQKDTCTPMQY